MGIRESVIERLGGSSEGGLEELQERLMVESANADLVRENFALLELAMEEQGWQRFGASTRASFSRAGIENLTNISQMMYMANPLIKRAVNVKTYYTWGQGVEVEAKDSRVQDDVITPMMEDEGNKAEYFAHHSRILTHIDKQVEGNLFFRMPTDLLGNVQLRSVESKEIRDIHTKPGDRQQIWFYLRVWNEDEFSLETGNSASKDYSALYPDYRFHPRNKPSKIGDYEVKWDEPIIHMKSGGLKHMQFGVPETYAALDWARAYKRFLEDWHTIVKSLAKFAWQRTAPSEKLEAEKKKLDERRRGTAEASETRRDKLRERPAGGVALTAEGTDLTPINKAGTTTQADDARASRLMVAAAQDLPDTILSGDVDIGNFATSKTLDRPTELAMVNEQLLFKAFEQAIFNYAIQAKIRRGLLPGTIHLVAGGNTVAKPEKDPEVLIKFPPVLEHDVKESVGALVTAATLEGKTDAGTLPREQLSRELMNALGWDDIEGMIKELPDQERQDLLAAAKALHQALGTGPPEDKPPDPAKTNGAGSE